MRRIEFFFDVVSPYVWLAWHALEKGLAEFELQVIPVPTLFAGLLTARGGIGPAEIPEKRAYTFRDVRRSALLGRLELKGPPRHPFNPLKALRLCCAVGEPEQRLRLAGALLDAAWSEGKDLEADATLAEALASVGAAGSLLEASTTPAIKDQLRANGERALALGLFGVPSFVADGELFWGHDRIAQLAAHLRGELVFDERAHAEWLARPRGADRKR
jgi:2-hydroxychromene-2-carboxylate isomerase